MTTVNISTWVDVDVDLSEIEDDELLEELESRGLGRELTDDVDTKSLLEAVWVKRRNGYDYQKELDDLIYHALGKIV